MKNLIKLLAIIAMITVSASNVCAQVDNTVYFNNYVEKDTTFKFNVPFNKTSGLSLTIQCDGTNAVAVYVTIKGIVQVLKLTSDNGYSATTSSFDTMTVSQSDTIIISTYGISEKTRFKVSNNRSVGLNNNLLAAELNLYSYDNMVVLENKATPKPLSVNIYNLSGQLVVTENVDGLISRNEISTSLPNGIYMVHVSDGVNTMVKKLYISK